MAEDLNSYLYLSNLHHEVTPNFLYWKYIVVGPIDHVIMIRDICGHTLGYAVLKYKFAALANKALNQMQGDIVKGKPIKMMRATQYPFMRVPIRCNLCLINFDWTVTSENVQELFSRYGKILYCNIFSAADGLSISSGLLAFIHYETEKSAQQALFDLQKGLVVNGKSIIKAFPEKDIISRVKRCKICLNLARQTIITSPPLLTGYCDSDIF